MHFKTPLSLLVAAVVSVAVYSGSIARSPSASSRNDHAARDNFQYVNPLIRDYGKVVRLPDAAHQPRRDSRVVVDITKGGDADKLNPAIEKVCRFVNIYAGAGKESAEVDIAVVIHGDATLAVLTDSAYSARFGTEENPNRDCMRELTKAGVHFYVCGQSLVGKDAAPSQVSREAKVAVSALTALVNLQSDGYAYLPMLK